MELPWVTTVFTLGYPMLSRIREINVSGGSHSPNLLFKRVKSCHVVGANPLK